jgi:hypothetical protein
MLAVGHPGPKRGAYRERHIRWAGDAVDADVPKTNGTEADGEIVWSWRPDAGAKLATMLAHHADDGGKRALVHRGEPV